MGVMADKTFNEQSDYWSDVADQNNFSAIWSMYTSDFEWEMGLAPRAHQRHPMDIEGMILSYQVHPFWGSSVDILVSGNTWLDLYRAANKAIEDSKDDHHVFIEDFDFTSSPDGSTITLITGS